jgi:hypothetical protein
MSDRRLETASGVCVGLEPFDHLHCAAMDLSFNTMQPSPILRFAVLWHHQVAEPHFDLMVETQPGSDLATWRSPVWPISERTAVVRLKDHRRVYLEYDGEISEGRGRVDRVGDGTCQIEIESDRALVIRFIEVPGVLRLERAGDQEWDATPI